MGKVWGEVGIVGVRRVELGKSGVRWVRWGELHPVGKVVVNCHKITVVH